MIAVEEVLGPAIQNYGVVVPEPVADGVYRIRGTVEKPAPEDAPSNLGIVGRYVLTPEVFDCLTRVKPGAIGEIQLTDGIGMLLGKPARLRPCASKECGTTWAIHWACSRHRSHWRCRGRTWGRNLRSS